MPREPEDTVIMSKSVEPAPVIPASEKQSAEGLPEYAGKTPEHQDTYFSHNHEEVILPTKEELHTLRRVSDKIPWTVITIAFVELCERFSYYGTTVVFTNYIQQPLPAGSTTGAGFGGQSGALNMGQQASTGLNTFNSFWVYCCPLVGAWIADAHWGRFKTICISLAVALTGHTILIISAIPPVIVHPNGSLAAFIIGIIIMGVGTGGFKPNISPLIIEQIDMDRMTVRTLPDGERVIVDPAVTASRIYHWFYLFINVGALIGQIGMVYCEKYVGFWLAYLLPTCMFLFCPAVMLWGRKRYRRSPPQGSVLGKCFRLFLYANKGRWSLNPVSTYKRLNDGTFWESVKPSNIPESQRPRWMTFDDQWVDEVGRGFAACSVFCWYPLYWLTYNQMTGNLTSQAATMTLNGLPNDVMSNLDPFALIIFIPICDLFIYPFFRKIKFNFSPIKKITAGFYTGAAAMVWACVVQAYIYKTNPCGEYAGTCDETSSLNVWIQTGAYVLIALSEIFASITSLEYAYSKAPRNMRSLVQSVALFTSALASALGEAFVSLSLDPLLVWNYGSMAVLSFIGGTLFWLQYRNLDAREDELNMLAVGHLDQGKESWASPTEVNEKAISKEEQ